MAVRGGSGVARALLLGVVTAGLFIAALDTYAVASVINSMITDLGISLDHLERATPILSGFLLGYLAGLPLGASLAAGWGHGRVYALGLGLFAAGSTLTAVSMELPELVAGRLLQGFAGGLMVPVALVLAADLFWGRRRVLALGLVAGVQELGSLLGPLYGAWIEQVASWGVLGGWRAIFWLNLPLAAACGAGYGLVRRRLAAPPEAVRGQGAGWGDSLLVAAAMAALVVALYPPDPRHSVTGPFLGAGMLGFAGLLAVVAWRARVAGWRRFLTARAWGALGVNLLVGAALVVALVDVPVLARAVFGLDDLGSALLLAWFMAGLPLGAVLGGWLGARYSLRGVCLAGTLLAAALFWLMADWGAGELRRRFLGVPEAPLLLILGGAGFGLLIAPLTAAVMESVTASRRALAGSLVVLTRSIGMLVGLAALSAVGLHRFYQLLHSGPRLSLTPGLDFAAQAAALQARATAALMAEYHDIFRIAAGICALAMLGALLSLPRHRDEATR